MKNESTARNAANILIPWMVAWIIVSVQARELWLVCLLAFFQNIAFTLVSRSRNGKSLWYHAGAATFSNGIYAVMLLFSIGFAVEKNSTASGIAFIVVYTLSTVSGSLLAHRLALQKESAKSKVATFDDLLRAHTEIQKLRAVVDAAQQRMQSTLACVGPRTEGYCEFLLKEDNTAVRIWLRDEDGDGREAAVQAMQKNPRMLAGNCAEMAQDLGKAVGARAVHVIRDGIGAVWHAGS